MQRTKAKSGVKPDKVAIYSAVITEQPLKCNRNRQHQTVYNKNKHVITETICFQNKRRRPRFHAVPVNVMLARDRKYTGNFSENATDLRVRSDSKRPPPPALLFRPPLFAFFSHARTYGFSYALALARARAYIKR